jgi:hypothetical protein
MLRRILVVAALAFSAAPALAQLQAPALSDQQIVATIIRESRSEYYATGHPCACPEDRAKNGSSCGARSAYSRPGGAMPKCYPRDVSKAEVEAYRAAHKQ